MGRNIASGIAAILLAVHPGQISAEVPQDYKTWPVVEIGGGTVTYRSGVEQGAQVVREFYASARLDGGRIIPFTIIGYASNPNEDPARSELEIGIRTRANISQYLERRLYDAARKNCGQCHPIVKRQST